jgi:dUTP pyrophosphatase
MDKKYPYLRRTIFDFWNWPEGIDENPNLRDHIRVDEAAGRKNGKYPLLYRLDPGENVLIGIGVVFGLPSTMFQWVTPRSGLSTKHNITLGNAPGTLDPDFRGEAGAIVKNTGNEPFFLSRGMRIAQIIFAPMFIPTLAQKEKFEDLSATEREAGGFGSTGLS